MNKPIELKLLGEAQLDPKPHAGLLTYNPTIELFARAAGPTNLQVWRSNGQIVAKVSQRGERESVQAIRWKADGNQEPKSPASNMHYMTNKHQITCIGWARNRAGRRSNAQSDPSILAWEDLASRGLDSDDVKNISDLPRDLTFLEVETALPKISPLPVSGGSGDDMFVFTTRASLEFLFRPFSPQDSDKVDVMIVGTNDGRIHLSIYDSFVIGNFNYTVPQSLGSPNPVQLVSHASHPELSTHTLVFKPSGDAKSRMLYLVPMDLTFVYSSPENLSLLASKTTTLQKLLRYLKQVKMHMLHEWQSTRELPCRFLNSIDESLKEAGTYGEMGIRQALYHSVVTGHTFPEVKEWLVDQLAERVRGQSVFMFDPKVDWSSQGHKRWDKAVVSGLQALRSLVHENFLPALERIGIILSRLLGIARFHESREEIGFSSAQITKVMDIVSCLMLVGNRVLLLVMEELDLFQSFSSWLRHEIDRLASSSSSDELTEKEATMEHGKILTYIQQYMPASPLRYYLSNVASDDADTDWQQAESGSSLLDMLDRQVKKHESGQPHTGVFSQIEFLCKYLGSKTNVVFEGIAEAEKRSVRFGQPAKVLLNENIARFDVRMSAAKIPGLTFTALTTESRKSNGQPLRIVRIPHRADDLGFQPYQPGSAVTPHVLSNEEVTTTTLNMVVPTDPGFVPVQMEVKEASSERGYIPSRVCLLGSDLQTYKIFALPDDPFKEAAKSREDDVMMQ
ncbi:hypothetical protein DL766_000724 [Monosporascus sp. MC13-8B]|uniref:Anaphase-promoting complex subunit 4 n=1 Tax=Monosporascus cannonballus TaxID=155416 RepID=A0ABY0H8V2_9PEZI|nr:hypothetical protein DL762_004007 [Monosporascus cannonballus]RYO97765.1 hypothetical protein DL763_002561 [Monosporascus cannonballus]RYP38915.1 hypothetical protein DL766_000724 [Monosporascus sp. MC13-8B]